MTSALDFIGVAKAREFARFRVMLENQLKESICYSDPPYKSYGILKKLNPEVLKMLVTSFEKEGWTVGVESAGQFHQVLNFSIKESE